jgi:hypothetical protein
LMAAKLRGFSTITRLFPAITVQSQYVGELRGMLYNFAKQSELFPPGLADEAAGYLFAELTSGQTAFALSRVAADLHEALQMYLRQNSYERAFAESLEEVQQHPASVFGLLRDWVAAFLEQRGKLPDETVYADEVATALLQRRVDGRPIISGRVDREISGLVGTHPVIASGVYHLNYNAFQQRLENFDHEIVPRYRQYIDLKKEFVDEIG